MPVRPGGQIPRTPPIMPYVHGSAAGQAIPTTPEAALTAGAQLHNALTTAAQAAILQPAQHARPTGVGRGLEGAGEGDDRPKKSRSADF